jgi:anti-sigma B factor antagonist
MALLITIRNNGGIAIVDLKGTITLGENTAILRNEMQTLLSQGTTNIILNMAQITYVDSAGLGELVGVYTTAANKRASVKLLHLQDKMRSLMQITKLHTVFSVFDDEQSAITSFGAAAVA